MKNRIYIFFLFQIFLIFCCGCSGAVELQETGIVMGIGVDLAEGSQDAVEITVEIANYSQDASSGSSSQQDNIFKSQGSTITDAINNLNAYIDKYLFWGHNKIIVFGESALQSGINKYIDAFIRNAEMRPTAFLIACEGKAADIFEGKSGLSPSVSFGIAGILDRGGKQTMNKKLGINVQQYSEQMLNEYPSSVLPLLRIKKEEAKDNQQDQEKEKQGGEKKEIEFVGYTVVSSEGKTVYSLDKIEQLGAFIWLKKLEEEIITVENGEHKFSVEIYSPSVKLKYENEELSIDVEADCKMFEAFIPEQVNEQLDTEAINKCIKDYVEKALQSAFEAEIQCNEDFLEIGQHMHRHNTDELKSMQNFPADLPMPKINVKVNVVFTGEIFNTI